MKKIRAIKRNGKRNGLKAPKWKDEFIYKAYQMSREGYSNDKIEKALGIERQTMRRWLKSNLAFRKAIADGRDTENGLALPNYIFNHLSPHLRALWDEIAACDDTTGGMRQIEALLYRCGKRARQSLFVYVWTRSCFSITRAMHKIQISKCTFDEWCHEDSFRKLVAEITWHKKNFYEDALAKCISRGEVSAIVFANKTFNRDRGYNERIDLNISGSAEVVVTPVSQLGMSMEDRKKLLGKMREQKALKEADAEVVDD